MYQNLVRAALAALTLCAGLEAAVAAPAAPAARLAPPKAPLKVAFVYASPVGSTGWSYQHNMGRLAMELKLDGQVQTRYVENVAAGAQTERVLRDLAAQGHQLIFATGFGDPAAAQQVAQEFPSVAFEQLGGSRTAPNLNTYRARSYEGRYLVGLIAGRMSKTGVAGYVASRPTPEVIRDINAFALGMRRANPKAQVRVSWVGAAGDPAKEREAAGALVNGGADTLSYHGDSTAVPELAEAKRVMLLGDQSDLRDIAPNTQLTSTVHDWGAYYTAVTRSVIQGQWKARPFWGGVRERVIRLAPLSSKIPADVQHQVIEVERSMAAGRFHPFTGTLIDQAGQVRQRSGHLSDAQLLAMDYFLQGVEGTLQKQ